MELNKECNRAGGRHAQGIASTRWSMMLILKVLMIPDFTRARELSKSIKEFKEVNYHLWQLDHSLAN
jgi:hypothetical protein